MGILNLFSKKSPAPDLKAYAMPQAHGFKGFKRLYLTNHNDKESEKGLKALKKSDFDFTNKTITLEEFRYNNDKNVGIAVSVDGNKIGSFFANAEEDKKYLDIIHSGNFEKLYAKVEASSDRYNTYLFIKIKE